MPDLGGVTGDAAKILAAIKAGGWLSKALPSGLGLGGIPPWLGGASRLAGTAGLAAATGLGAYQLAKQPAANVFGIGDYYTTYQDYLKGGGNLSYNKWSAAGKPKSAQALMTKEQAETRFALAQLGAPERERARTETEKEKAETERTRAVKWDTIIDPDTQMIISVAYNAAGEMIDSQPTGQFAPRPEKPETARPPTTYPQFGQDPYGGQGQYNPYTGQWEPPAGYISPQQQWERDEAARKAAATQAWQGQQMAWQQQQVQMQQQEQDRQYRSQLAASPMSWLQLASYIGKTPVIPPGLLPLMPQQYQGLGAGANLPGWQGGGQGQQGGWTGMSQLPQLTDPSAQYWGRMGPTNQQLYMGYQQAQQGASPEETQFRLQSQAPPSGRYGGLSWMR